MTTPKKPSTTTTAQEAAPWPEDLSEAHVAYFQNRGVRSDIVAKTELASVDGAEAASLLGRTHQLAHGGLAFIYLRLSTLHQQRTPDTCHGVA